MKKCPDCKNTYTDESLVYCLADGSKLIALTGTEETVSFPGLEETATVDRNPVRVEVPQNKEPESVPTFMAPAFAPPPQQTDGRRGTNWLVTGVLAALLLIVVLGFAGFAAYVFFKPGTEVAGNSNAGNTNTPVSLPPPTNMPVDGINTAEQADTEDLQEKLANLEKRLEEQQKQASASETPSTPVQTGNTARVHSPGDGFLALRSDPDTETGFRVTKIAHGSTVQVLACRGYSYVGKTRGRWCQISYGGQTGWAFDAFLRY